jgi:hypothetical protein
MLSPFSVAASDGKRCWAVEEIMNFRMLLALVFTLLAVSACIVEPMGGGRGGYYGGGGGHDDGHRVWH